MTWVKLTSAMFKRLKSKNSKLTLRDIDSNGKSDSGINSESFHIYRNGGVKHTPNAGVLSKKLNAMNDVKGGSQEEIT